MSGDWKRERKWNPETCRFSRFDREYQQIRNDNLRYMKGVILARYFYDLLSIAIPTVIACLVGNMADYLLALDREKIYAVLPFFLLALALNSLGAPLANMVQYQAMIKQSFAYDEYMMNRFIHKPLKDIERQGIGEILERLGGDLGDFSWNTVILISSPLVIISYGTVLVWTLLRSGVTLLFLVLLLMISGLPVLKAQMTAGKKAIYQRKLSEYNERRRGLEAETCATSDFLNNYHLEEFTKRRFRTLYDIYMEQSGRKKQTFEGVNITVDFLLKYGMYLCVLGAGAFLTSQGLLSAGTVLTGYLSLSSIGKCYTYGVHLIEQRKSAKEYMSRIAVFYGKSEENDETSIQKMSVQKEMISHKERNAHKEMTFHKERNAHKEMIPHKEPGKDCVTELHAENLTFSYDKSHHPVIKDFSMTLRYGDCVEIMGANGCGKSTLLNLLCGLYRPDEGRIRNQAGYDLSIAGLRKAVAIQEQSGAIFSGTVFENLFLPAERYQEAEEMRLEFGLEKSLDYVTETEGQNLSPGERKKILLIRALLAPSEFCLLDEPLNHLDEKGRQALTFRLLRDKRGFVIVSHQDILPACGEIRRYHMM